MPKSEQANLFFDKVLTHGAQAIVELSQHGDATGEPYVLVMLDDGKDNGQLTMLNAVDCGRWVAEQWDPATQVVWTELQAKMAANPTKIPVIIRSGMFEMAGWRLLNR